MGMFASTGKWLRRGRALEQLAAARAALAQEVENIAPLDTVADPDFSRGRAAEHARSLRSARAFDPALPDEWSRHPAVSANTTSGYPGEELAQHPDVDAVSHGKLLDEPRDPVSLSEPVSAPPSYGVLARPAVLEYGFDGSDIDSRRGSLLEDAPRSDGSSHARPGTRPPATAARVWDDSAFPAGPVLASYQDDVDLATSKSFMPVEPDEDRPVPGAYREAVGRQQPTPPSPASDRGWQPIVITAEQDALGNLSKIYEADPRGAGTVSTGKGDRGGVSYGAYQLSSKMGQVDKFLKRNGRRWAREFQGMKPATAPFNAKWQEIAERDHKAFFQAQHAYIEATHYRPAVRTVFSRTRLNLDRMSAAARNVTWSSSVQHRTAADVLTNAILATDKVLARSSPQYEELLINNIYDGRVALVDKLRRSSTYSKAERAGYANMIKNRFKNERVDALRMLTRARK